MENPKFVHRFFLAIVLSITVFSVILSIRYWDSNLIYLTFSLIGLFALVILLLSVIHVAAFAPVMFLFSWLFGDKKPKQPTTIVNKSIKEGSARD